MTEAQADRVRTVMRALLLASHSGNKSSLARTLNLSQSAVSQILGDPEKGIPPKNRPSDETARVVAKLAGQPDRFWLTGDTADGVVVEGTASSSPFALSHAVPPTDVRDRVIDALLEDGVTDDAGEAYRAVRSIAFQHGDELALYREARKLIEQERRPEKARLGERPARPKGK